jgi:hypothetical protein
MLSDDINEIYFDLSFALESLHSFQVIWWDGESKQFCNVRD